MNQKVVIIGYSFSSRLCLARALGKFGFNISIIALNKTKSKPIDCYSKYVKNYYYTQGDDEKKLIEILLNKCKDDNQKVILIPVNDFAASVLDKNQNLLERYFIYQHIHHTQGAVIEWMNKEKQKALAKNNNLNIAYSTEIKITNRSYIIADNIHYPCFTKTKAFVSGYKFTLHRCDDEHQLRIALDEMCRRFENLTLLVEDYKNIEKEYAVVGFSNGHDVIIPGVIEITSMAKGSDAGIALQGRVVPCSGYDKLVKSFESFIRDIGYVGLFDIDFYLSEGLYYFGELNLRIGGSGFAIINKGVNLPLMHVKSLLNEPIDNMKKCITDSYTFSNERICMENWFEGLLSNQQFFTLLKTGDVSTIKSKNDKVPELIFWLKAIKKFFILLFKNRNKNAV